LNELFDDFQFAVAEGCEK